MGKFIDLTGQRFGKWCVIKRGPTTDTKQTMWYCVCDCGVEGLIKAASLRQGRSTGCLNCRNRSYWLPLGESGFNQIYSSYKLSAYNRTLDFTLSVEQVRAITSLPCWYCGAAPEAISESRNKSSTEEGRQHSRYIYNGIDRVDNSKGYVDGNVVPCCKKHNYAKNDSTIDDIHLINNGLRKWETLPDAGKTIESIVNNVIATTPDSVD